MPQWVIWVIIGLLLVVMFVLPMFTRKKQQTQVNTMLSSINVGDKIKTVGGIIGVVIKVEQVSPVDKEFVIETGDVNKSELRFDINAIYQIITKANVPESEAVPFEEAADVKSEETATELKTEEIGTKVEIEEPVIADAEKSVTETDSTTAEVVPEVTAVKEKSASAKPSTAPKSKTGAGKTNTKSK